jgi:hypothetical protein
MERARHARASLSVKSSRRVCARTSAELLTASRSGRLGLDLRRGSRRQRRRARQWGSPFVGVSHRSEQALRGLWRKLPLDHHRSRSQRDHATGRAAREAALSFKVAARRAAASATAGAASGPFSCPATSPCPRSRLPGCASPTVACNAEPASSVSAEKTNNAPRPAYQGVSKGM